MANDAAHNTATTEPLDRATPDVSLNVAAVAAAVAGPVTLTGSGFGAITNPAPTAYDFFDDYSAAAEGATVPQGSEAGSKWRSQANRQYQSGFEFDSDITLGNRPYSILAKGRKAHIDGLSAATGTGPDRQGGSFYGTHWIYLNESPYGAAHPDDLVSFKFARYWSDTDDDVNGDNDQSIRISMLFRNGGPTDGGNITGHQLPYLNGVSEPVYYDKNVWSAGKWIRFEYEITEEVSNGDGTFNAYGRVWIGGQLITTTKVSSGFSDTKIPLSDRPYPSYGLRTALIGSDPSPGGSISSTFRIRLAEVFERSDSARVELSNDPVFDDSAPQTRYCQLVDSWTDSSISIPEPFYGDLDESAPIYAFIISDGGASQSVINYGRVN
jgi:hypothetical protein